MNQTTIKTHMQRIVTANASVKMSVVFGTQAAVEMFKGMQDATAGVVDAGNLKRVKFALYGVASDFTTLPDEGDIVTVNGTQMRVIGPVATYYGAICQINVGNLYQETGRQ